MELQKEQIVFQRGEGGKLLSQDVILESIEGTPTIKVKPLTRGKLQEIYQKANSEDIKVKLEADNDVIKNGLVSPELSNEELDFMKPDMALAISQAILSVSLGMSQKEIGNKTQEVIDNQEYLVKKN